MHGLNVKQSRKAALDGVAPSGVCGSLSFGPNQPRVFLRLCQVFRDLGLDIINVESTVRRGWFAKLILARNRTVEPIPLSTLRTRLGKIAREVGFSVECFTLAGNHPDPRKANIAILVQAENKVGLLADLLEVLDKYAIDIIDIDLNVDEAKAAFVLILRVLAPVESADFYGILSAMRDELESLGSSVKPGHFSCMVHSTETFAFLQEIDYEAGF